MKLTKYHGLSPQESQELFESLDQLLADFQVAEENAKKLYWNLELKPYFDFHKRLGQLYEASRIGSNVVADNIMRLGHTPESSEVTALTKSHIQPIEGVETFEDACMLIVNNSRELLQSVKEVFQKATEYQEQYTIALMSRLAHQLAMNIHFFLSMRSAMMN
ncbi:MAG: hypothetical protein D6730_21550 [Bacteroidetes bacterium]|nr:MAG: hypothetical protein D6730_21550 [Bacteroidota bacterium]